MWNFYNIFKSFQKHFLDILQTRSCYRIELFAKNLVKVENSITLPHRLLSAVIYFLKTLLAQDRAFHIGEDVEAGAPRRSWKKAPGLCKFVFLLDLYFCVKNKRKVTCVFSRPPSNVSTKQSHFFWPLYVWDMCWNLRRKISQGVLFKDLISLCSLPYFEGVLLYLNDFCSNTMIPEANIEPVQSSLRTGEVKGVGFGGLLEQTNFTRYPKGNNISIFTKVKAIWQVATKPVRLRTQRWACFNTYFS